VLAMKKYIPLTVVVIFSCVSLLVKQDLMMHGDSMSSAERANNYCLQMLTMTPATTVIGFTLLMCPAVPFKWWASLLKIQFNGLPVIQSVVLRIIGIIMIVSTLPSIRSECITLIR